MAGTKKGKERSRMRAVLGVVVTLFWRRPYNTGITPIHLSTQRLLSRMEMHALGSSTEEAETLSLPEISF